MHSKLKALLPLSLGLVLLGMFALSHGADYLHLLLTVGGAISFCCFGNSNQTIGLAAGGFVITIIGLVFAGLSAGFLPALALLGMAVVSFIGAVIVQEN